MEAHVPTVHRKILKAFSFINSRQWYVRPFSSESAMGKDASTKCIRSIMQYVLSGRSMTFTRYCCRRANNVLGNFIMIFAARRREAVPKHREEFVGARCDVPPPPDAAR